MGQQKTGINSKGGLSQTEFADEEKNVCRVTWKKAAFCRTDNLANHRDCNLSFVSSNQRDSMAADLTRRMINKQVVYFVCNMLFHHRMLLNVTSWAFNSSQ